MLQDIVDMPDFNSTVEDGAHSVSEGKVKEGYIATDEHNRIFECLNWVPTVYCISHGAILCVANNEKGKIWRCPACNEGAYEPK